MRFQINLLAPSTTSSPIPWVRTLSGRFSHRWLIDDEEVTNQNTPCKTNINTPHLQG
jgi:hypothetical protein